MEVFLLVEEDYRPLGTLSKEVGLLIFRKSRI